MSNDKYYIVAGNYAEATFIASSYGLRANDWIYLDNEEKILGIRNPRVWFYGSYEKLHNIDIIKETLTIRNVTIEYITPNTARW